MVDNPPGRTKAIIAYITIIGFLIALSMNKDKPERFATWHVKNMFGLCLIMIIAIVTQYHIHLIAGDILYIIGVVLWVYSLIMALQNKKRGVPYFDNKFQEWFTFLGQHS